MNPNHPEFVTFDPAQAGTALRTGPTMKVPYDPDTQDFIKQRRINRSGLNRDINRVPHQPQQ